VPRRRHQSFLSRVVSGAGALGFRAWDPIARRPVDSIAIIAAIAKFECDHNLPSSGRVSDRLVKELTTMVGHPID
jgi:hypothetical protein